LTELLQEIEGSGCIFQDTISPDKNSELFINLLTTDGSSTRIPNCIYRDKLVIIISPTYKPHRFKATRSFLNLEIVRKSGSTFSVRYIKMKLSLLADANFRELHILNSIPMMIVLSRIRG